MIILFFVSTFCLEFNGLAAILGFAAGFADTLPRATGLDVASFFIPEALLAADLVAVFAAVLALEAVLAAAALCFAISVLTPCTAHKSPPADPPPGWAKDRDVLQ
ncbi:MAG: hypothetical protein JNM30_15825 [Rhodospirillales bacterium]|nr:hypothetical protein [Rhodospirillales bacterium]